MFSWRVIAMEYGYSPVAHPASQMCFQHVSCGITCCDMSLSVCLSLKKYVNAISQLILALGQNFYKI